MFDEEDYDDSVVELTTGEQEVLHLLAQRCSNVEISDYLGISLSKVKNHIRNIFWKLGVFSRRDAVTIARRLQIVPSHSLAITPSPSHSILPMGWQLLSRREQEVALFLSNPKTVSYTERHLANELGMKIGTLKKHLQHIYRKLGVGNRAGAVLLTMRAAEVLAKQQRRAI